ncbi:MAG: hypothetical protein HYS32_02545 [Candidatus Woesearchaeota archaeon]|nr:MAG: hypothetical protein HYS32_02545 [Candidatus Woesearchaeota archaeon]
MKKAQMEIVGLVVIVLIILLAAIFFVRFALLSHSSSKTSSIESIEANNLLNALLRTTICEDLSVEDAIKECKQRSNICNEEACKHTKTKIEEIMEASLDEKTTYSIDIDADEVPLINIENCKTGITASPFSIPSRGITYSISMKLCAKK